MAPSFELDAVSWGADRIVVATQKDGAFRVTEVWRGGARAGESITLGRRRLATPRRARHRRRGCATATLLAALRHPKPLRAPTARAPVTQLRDLWRASPTLEDPSGTAAMSTHAGELLKAL